MSQERLDNYNKQKRLELLNYDKKRHIALLKKQSLLKENSEKLSRDSFELLESYSILLHMQLNFEVGYEFLSLIENFLEHKISAGDFRCKFSERTFLNDDVKKILESNLILLSLHPNSFDFGSIIEEIFMECYFSDFEETDAEKNFYNYIQKKFLELQNYLS